MLISAEVAAVAEALTAALQDVLSHRVDVRRLATTTTPPWWRAVALQVLEHVHRGQHVEHRVQTRQQRVAVVVDVARATAAAARH